MFELTIGQENGILDQTLWPAGIAMEGIGPRRVLLRLFSVLVSYHSVLDLSMTFINFFHRQHFIWNWNSHRVKQDAITNFFRKSLKQTRSLLWNLDGVSTPSATGARKTMATSTGPCKEQRQNFLFILTISLSLAHHLQSFHFFYTVKIWIFKIRI